METLEIGNVTQLEVGEPIVSPSKLESSVGINIKLADDNVGTPIRGSEHAVGYDLKANISTPINTRLWMEFSNMGANYKALFSHNGKWQIAPVRQFVSLFSEDVATRPVEVIRKGECKLIDAGFSVELPPGIGMFIYPRSSLKTKGIISQVGIIDPDYRGPVKYELFNLNPAIDFLIIKRGDRIAQAVFQQFYPVHFNIVDELSSTIRGEGGFGSTGV